MKSHQTRYLRRMRMSICDRKYLRNQWKPMFVSILLMFIVITTYLDISSEYMPYITYSIYGEEMQDVNGTRATLCTDYGLNTYTIEPITLQLTRELVEDAYYVQGLPFVIEGQPRQYGQSGESGESDIKLDSFDANERDGVNENYIKDFFNTVTKITGTCRKLYRAGGQLSCRNSSKTEIRMDGHKLICLDDAMQIATGSRLTKDCLCLSFGVNYDISFDIDVRDINCEIIFFDIDEYNHVIIEEDEYVNFFQIGIANERITELIKYEDDDKVVHFNNFNNLAMEYGFENRIINIVKIDIEGGEWDVLKDMSDKLYLDTIGQLVIEIHAGNFKSMTSSEIEKWTMTIKATFKTLEERGFKKVSYFPNTVSEVIGNGKNSTLKYHAAGELLLVNSNWYDLSFRKRAVENGLQFEL